MPELIRTDHGLPTLQVALVRVTLADGRPDEQVVLRAVVGDRPGREVLRCAPAELGLRDDAESPPERSFRLPAGAGGAVADAVAAMDAEGAHRGALWLELPPPCGDLHLVPWERLLSAAVTDRPVLRLPYHTLRPRTSYDVFRVALTCPLSLGALPPGTPLAEVVAAHARRWVTSSAGSARVDVFVRDETTRAVRALTADVPEIVVQDPAYAQDLPASGQGSGISPADLTTNPWLLWMTHALGGQAVDVSHVLTYGDLGASGGRMMLARSPIAGGDRDACLLVGATPLGGALAQLGAWALVLSGLAGDPSPAALRDLADAIARLRPGAVVAHAVTGSDTDQFGAAVARVFAGGPAMTALPALACWVHPDLVGISADEAEALLLTPEGQSAVIPQATGDVLGNVDTPAWVAAGTRYLEAQQADWIGSTRYGAADDAAKNALHSVSELLDAHVRKHVVEPGGGEGTTT
jgi:hypothetical protein